MKVVGLGGDEPVEGTADVVVAIDALEVAGWPAHEGSGAP